jgi:hypothetical protein
MSGLWIKNRREGLSLHPDVKQGFINLQAAILSALISKDVNEREADAYRKMCRLLLNLQKDYEELLDLYALVGLNKKPLSSTNEQEQLSNMSIKVYQFSRRV